MSDARQLPESAFDLLNDSTTIYPRVVQQARASFEVDEARLLYRIIQLLQPRQILEFGCGLTTAIILSVLSEQSYLLTIAKEGWAHHETNIFSQDPRWEWQIGEIRQRFNPQMRDNIDFLLIDAEHTVNFAEWAQTTVLPLRPYVPIMIHDWFPGQPERWNTEEAQQWDSWFAKHPEYKMYFSFGRDTKLGQGSVWLYRTEN